MNGCSLAYLQSWLSSLFIISIASIRKCIYLAKTVPASYDTTETVEAIELKRLKEMENSDPAAKHFDEETVEVH